MTTGWHSCALCGAATQYALGGNRLLSHTDVKHLPTEQAPQYSWRCEGHWRHTMRTAAAVRASEEGDVLLTLTCGHELCWVCRGRAAYTPAKIEHALTTRQIRLDQPQRCYVCGDLAREREANQ